MIDLTFIVWGRPEITELTFRSFAQSTFKNDVYVRVVENGSSDGDPTSEIVRRFADSGFVDECIRWPENRGKVQANNEGWSRGLLSGAEILATSENDVCYSPGWLKASLDVFKQFPEVGQVSWTDHEEDRHKRGRTTHHSCREEVRDGVVAHYPENGVIPGSVLVRSEIVLALGGHKSSGKKYSHSCPEFCGRLARAKWKSAYSPGYAFHIHPQNITWPQIGLSDDIARRYMEHVERLAQMRRG